MCVPVGAQAGRVLSHVHDAVMGKGWILRVMTDQQSERRDGDNHVAVQQLLF